MKVRSLEESTWRYARNSARAFLEGTQDLDLKWITGVLEHCGLSKEETLRVLLPLRSQYIGGRAAALFDWLDSANW